MDKYNIIFQDDQVLQVIMANSNAEARAIFNKSISVKIRRCGIKPNKPKNDTQK